jgi:hypothetical protein
VGKSDLRIDWATYEAAKFACQNWHYSRCMPVGKMVKIGVWENDLFIGVVLFSYGASPPFFIWAKNVLGCSKCEIVELTRVALREHNTPVSKIIAIALKMLQKHCPKLRCVVSFADCDQNHHGGIYQAGNWLFAGTNCIGERCGFLINGKKMHPRSLGAKGYEQSLRGAKMLDPKAVELKTKGKNKYLMPLDDEMRKRIEPLRKPYPKRVRSVESDTPINQ